MSLILLILPLLTISYAVLLHGINGKKAVEKIIVGAFEQELG